MVLATFGGKFKYDFIISNGVTADTDILDWPIWILCINIVAIEMLRSKLPPGKKERAIIFFSD